MAFAEAFVEIFAMV